MQRCTNLTEEERLSDLRVPHNARPVDDQDLNGLPRSYAGRFHFLRERDVTVFRDHGRTWALDGDQSEELILRGFEPVGSEA